MFEAYEINKDNTARFTLGRYVSKPLVVFGINPSTATKEKNDTTISIVEHISAMRKCDGYIMLNIYPLRATNIDANFDKSCNKKLSDENRMRYEGGQYFVKSEEEMKALFPYSDER